MDPCVSLSQIYRTDLSRSTRTSAGLRARCLMSLEGVQGPSSPSSMTGWPSAGGSLQPFPAGSGPPWGPVQPVSGLCPKTLPVLSPTFPSAPMKETIGGQRGETGGEEGNPNSAPFESGSSELRVWGKFLWILVQIYIPRVWGSDIYIHTHIFHSIWKVFDAREMEMEKPSDVVLKLAAAKLLREPAQSVLLSGLQTF